MEMIVYMFSFKTLQNRVDVPAINALVIAPEPNSVGGAALELGHNERQDIEQNRGAPPSFTIGINSRETSLRVGPRTYSY
ncbi:hypothetical protein EDF68_1414 [Ochrobactrum sp. BH3]|nr:hypothetical protein EDF68_1414 [Ochrobactrum sp. BH3]